MAHNVEPMDIDSSVCDFDDKENAFQHSNMLPRSPCTEKGYEELDVSELNMKLRYSITPVSSPMSKSYTASCLDNRHYDSNENPTVDSENGNLTRSLNSTLTKNDSMGKSPKSLPLQILSTDHFVENTRNVLRPLDSALAVDNNVTITVSDANEIDENISFPSSTSSMTNTPEATTPTSELTKNDGGSPILRGLKSVLNMFRPSQSPIPASEHEKAELLPEVLSPPIVLSPETSTDKAQSVLASTPLAAYKTKDVLSKRNSQNRDSIVFNEDLEKELQWKDESTILFGDEKIPIHKLMMPSKPTDEVAYEQKDTNEKLDSTVEFMDISYNDSVLKDKTIEILSEGKTEKAADSDSEFVDCESTFTKNESQLEDFKDVSIDNISDNLLGDLNVTKEALNVTGSVKSTDISAASILTTKATINIILPEVATPPEGADAEVKQEPIESTISLDHTNDENTISPDIQPEEPMLEDLVKTLSKLHDNFATTKPLDNVGNYNFNLDQPDVVVSSNNDSSNKSPDHNSNTDTMQINTEMKMHMDINSIVSVSTLENLVINSLSQIPLISDPRVLLFNIPSDELICEVKPQHDDTSLVSSTEEVKQQQEVDAIPADVPLPDDDDDVEKLVSLPTLDLIKETVVMDVVAQDVNQKQNSAHIETGSGETTEINSEAELKNVNLGVNANEICEIVLPSNIDIPDKINEIQTDLFDGTPFTVEDKDVESKHSFDLPEKIKDEQPISINEVPEPIYSVKNDTNLVNNITFIPEDIDIPFQIEAQEINVKKDVISVNEQEGEQIDSIKTDTNVANSITFIPEVIDIPIQIESQEINIEKDIKSVKEHVICNNEQKGVTENNVFCGHKNETLVEKKSVAEELIASLGDIVKPTVLDKAPEELQNIVHSMPGSVPISFDVGAVEKPVEITENKTLPELNHIDIHRKVEVNMDIAEIKQNKNDSRIYLKETLDTSTNKIISERLENKEGFNSNGEENIKITVVHAIETNVSVAPVDGLSNTLDNERTDAVIVEDKKNEAVPNAINTIAVVIETESHGPEICTVAVAQEKQVNIIMENMEVDTPEIETESISNKIIAPPSCTSDTQIIESNEDVLKAVQEAKPMSELLPAQLEQNLEQKMETEDIEIVTSENNSPFVSVSVEEITSVETQTEHLEIENPFASEGKLAVSPPISPKIMSKGYNFNFDEIEDPFATKTNIRMSPTPDDTSNQSLKQMEDPTYNIDFAEIPRKEFNKNRRKSQPARQKPINSGKKLNSTVSFNISAKEPTGKAPTQIKNEKPIDKVPETFDNNDTANARENIEETTNFTSKIIKAGDTSILLATDKPDDVIKNEENKSPVESFSPVPSEIKNTSSSEQSTYFSADTGTSSNEGLESKNVFNIPEIDDRNFNPFATKSKMRASPPPIIDEDPFASNIKLRDSPEPTVNIAQINKIDNNTNVLDSKQVDLIIDKTEDRLETALEEKDSLNNVSSATCSSKTTDDKDTTVLEIHTEDEDTVEGPFLEADDLNEDKLSDYEGEHVDMMQFSDLPPANEDIAENGELFIDAEAFEFLLNQNKCNTVSDSGKESLFLKFDPLFAKRVSSDGVVAALSKIKKQSTPKKVTKPPQKDATFLQTSPIPGSSTLNVTHEVDPNSTTEESNDDLNITVSKPMMVVNPAVNPVVIPRKSITPVRSNRHSLTFTSPAIAVIDRLLSLSANNSPVNHDTTIAEVSREQTEADMALTQLRELLADKEISVYNLRTETKELKDRLSNLESQMKSLESTSEERLKKINDLTEKLNEKTKINKSMATVVEEYERTIASLIAQTEQDKKRNAEERLQLIKERDEQTAHLSSMEVSFSDLHSKYEKSKQVILGFKANEDSCKKAIKEFEDNLTKMQNNYELLKQHATSKLNHANEELQKMNRAHESEVLKLNAMIKRKELHITSLEETLLQKTKANDELTAICDELINKVG